MREKLRPGWICVEKLFNFNKLNKVQEVFEVSRQNDTSIYGNIEHVIWIGAVI